MQTGFDTTDVLLIHRQGQDCLLPEGFAEEMRAAQLRDVLVHECAHVAQRHHAAGLLQRLAVILFWFPLVYYLVNWSSRYRMPIEWVLVLLASVAAAGIYQRFYSTAAITERRASTIS